MSKQVFKKLAQEIDFKLEKGFENLSVTKANLLDENTFELEFYNEEIISFDEMRIFLYQLSKNFKYKVKFKFNILSPKYTIENVRKYIIWITKEYLKNVELSNIMSHNLSSVNPNGIVDINVPHSYSIMKMKEHKNTIERIMMKFGFENIDLNLHINGGVKILEDEKNKILNDFENYKKSSKKSKNKNIMLIKDVYQYENMKVTLEGKVVNKDEFKTRNNVSIITFNVTDLSEAIYVKVFALNDEQRAKYENINPGDFVSVIGNLQQDKYSKQQTVVSNSIKKIEQEDETKRDEAQVKRVELNFRSNMSTMDGVKGAKDIVKYIKKINHKAVAIMDSNSVQSFPDFYNTSLGEGIKGIYGATIGAVPKNSQAIYHFDSRDLSSDEYVVFDLETTGLSPEYDELIEFGAVIIKNNQILDKKQFYVKPTKPIPTKIIEITRITDSMVKDAISQKEGISEILDYIKDKTLVAHNANFDLTYLKALAKRHLNKEVINPTIDTMITSRMALPKFKRFRLESVAKKYDVLYDNTVSHRADYDADVLSQIWMKQISDLNKMGITNQKDLNDYTDSELYDKAFSYEVSVIALNQLGLKELFEITSKTLTENLHKKGKYFMEDFKKRENIIIGTSALKGKLVDLMFTGTKEQMREEISKYDYVEIQPYQNFAHLLNGDFSKNNFIDVMKFIVHEAKAQNKIVVATGDARYFAKSEKRLHEIYINAKGLGGARHYLFKYDKSRRNYPFQNILTTNEMKEELAYLGDEELIHELVVTNSNKIAAMTDDNIEVIKKKLYTPTMDDVDEKLEKLVYENARKKYGENLPKIIADRIKREIEPIKKYGFSVIYWISYMLVDKSLRDGYLVGSRGSVGSSLVATMSNITEVNPLAPHYVCKNCKWSEFFPDSKLNSGYDLPNKNCPNCEALLNKEGQKIPFETFLGFEADKVPDIDLNFSGDYQPIIHNEVRNIFGSSHSFRAGTISTVAEKTAFGYVKAWSEENDNDISKAYTEYLAKEIAGTKRTTGQHPGGIIVIPKNMSVEDFTPINYPANDKNSAWKTTNLDFHAIHDNVLKLDLLGHDDPTAIKYLESLTNVDVKKDIPFYDEKIISLFSSPDALDISSSDIMDEKTGVMGIPEFGTTFVRRMLNTAKVKSFGDLISVSGLSHGTDVWSGNAEEEVKLGKELSDVISCRDNIMTDLMEKGIESSSAFDIMEKVRKGKGLTDHQEKLLRENNVEKWYIESLKKIKYMFPKAHATAYVMMAWRIAWFKLYKPRAYYATYFTTRADVFDIETVIQGKNKIEETLREFKRRRNSRSYDDKLSNKEVALIPILEIANEAYARKISFSNIDLNKSDPTKWLIDKETNELIPPFVSLDGLGEAVAHSVIAARTEKPFTSIEDVSIRTGLNKTVINKLKEIGVFKNLSEKNQISFMDILV